MSVLPMLLSLLLGTCALGAAVKVDLGSAQASNYNEKGCQFTHGDREFDMCSAFAISGDKMKMHGHNVLNSDFDLFKGKHGHDGFVQNFYNNMHEKTAEVS